MIATDPISNAGLGNVIWIITLNPDE